MKNLWSLFAAIALGLACVGPVQADELSSSFLNTLGVVTPQGDDSPMTWKNENPAATPIPTAGVCQPGTFQYYCKEIWGIANSRCGPTTWRWTQCRQYRDPAGKWYYRDCGPLQETCTAPGGAECIPCQ